MFWFYHEYLDEAARFRIHRMTADTETDARRLHRQACEFRWVTSHIRPSVSSLFTMGDYGPRTLTPSHTPGLPYRTNVNPIPMPDDIRQQAAAFKIGT
jgi:hypothetical protein